MPPYSPPLHERPPMEWRAHIKREPIRRNEYGLEVYGFDHRQGFVITPPKDAHIWMYTKMDSIGEKEAEFWDEYGQPLFYFGHDLGQQLIDELWRNGFRPTDYQREIVEKTDLKEHIGDLRRIAFRMLNIDDKDGELSLRGRPLEPGR